MIAGQLWYGWSAQGVEGVNQEQIIAASGVSNLLVLPLPQPVAQTVRANNVNARMGDMGTSCRGLRFARCERVSVRLGRVSSK